MITAFWKSLKKWFTGWLSGGPHFVVGSKTNPYLYRWYILPRNPFLNVYLHLFLRDDDDRAHHDHPWWSLSVVLGTYVEEHPVGVRRRYGPGSVILRRPEYTHRVELPGGRHCWTLFITGPRVREWGFHCPKGWVPWQQFTAPHDYGQIGRGCA